MVAGPDEYWLVRLFFHRGLALLYLVAFLVAANQFRPLAGENGLVQLAEYRSRWSFWERPSLLYLIPNDTAVGVVAWIGVVLSVLAFVGAPAWLPRVFVIPTSVLLWAVLWALYLSIVNAGQVFYGYGWESMLLETGFLAIFLGAGDTGTPVIVIWLLRWVLFRNMFGAGLIKIRGDSCWRDLTCLDYHYATQPMPNPLSWFAHHLPARFHRFETLGNHIVELAIPFLYFAPQPFAAIAGVLTIGFQGWLMLTGNFSWLNALTIVLAIATFNDPMLLTVLPIATPTPSAVPELLRVSTVILAGIVAILSVRVVRNMLSPTQIMNTSFDPLHLVNSYGAFGSITRDRYELVIEGTTASEIPSENAWRAYEFKGKPTTPSRRPPQVAPYHYRLDWQMWFAAMSPTPNRHPWFISFVEDLLSGDAAIHTLLATNPFPDEPPTYIRVQRYQYRFTTPSERAETGHWWHREPVGTYVPPVTLDDIKPHR